MGIRLAVGTRALASAAAAALLAGGLAACSATTGGSAASPVKTVTATAPASHDTGNSAAAPQNNGNSAAASQNNGNSAAASQNNGSSAGSNAATAEKLPDYRPSTVVSQSATTTVLKSPDSVEKVGTFYKSALASGGWDTTSSSVGQFHASFTASRAHEGVSISVYPGFGGSGISISRYPR